MVDEMEFWFSFLAVIWAAKLLAVFNATRWILNYGLKFRREFQQSGFVSTRRLFNLYAACRGDFWPCGVKDYRLRRRIRMISRPWWRRCVELTRYTFFRLNHLVVLTCVSLVFLTPLGLENPALVYFDDRSVMIRIALALAVLPMLAVLISTVESMLAYSQLGSYAEAFHILPYRNTRQKRGGRHYRLSELIVFLKRFVVALFAASTLCYVAQVGYLAFHGDTLQRLDTSSPMSWIYLFTQMAYFSATTMWTVGYGDIIPSGLLGQYIAFSVMCEGFLLLILVFAFLVASQEAESKPQSLEKERRPTSRPVPHEKSRQ